MLLDVISDHLIEETKQEDKFINEVLQDYWICCLSREASLLGRKEVLTGKAKFGILGDGKEVPQVAMARAFQKGDWRSGYYRDQTFMMAIGLCTVEDFFAQLYADPENDPFSGGRQMNAHFASPTIKPNGEWLNLTERYNVSSDISSTGGQMARGLGIAYASKKFRDGFFQDERFSSNGDEVSFVTIGDASTSEGIFWESLNAAVVEQVPLAVSVWDDGYGISVPKELQTAKASISQAVSGLLKDSDENGMYIYVGKAHDYAGLVEMYERGIRLVRKTHTPALFHIEECTQPQGHSTSGSHERYKSTDRLQWEQDFDCIKKMGEWMISCGIADEAKLNAMRELAKNEAREAKDRAWQACQRRAVALRTKVVAWNEAASALEGMASTTAHIGRELKMQVTPSYGESIALLRQLYQAMALNGHQSEDMETALSDIYALAKEDYHTHLYSNTPRAAFRADIEAARFAEDAKSIPGYQILNQFFDQKMAENPAIIAFGEDVGHIGDVNQGFAGLQEKYGRERVFDTGIREWSIMGQAIGAAMRGLRPIAEIQYLDYLIYGIEPLSDDLATLRYRSDGQQCAPAIIRTRGHRLEGIWHAGSPMGMIVNALRGMYVCVPRNMTQAAGMYNTLLKSDDPAIVVEPLNGYRIRETLPENLATFSVPLGLPEILQAGEDLTLVTYGSCVRVAQKALEPLAAYGISVELIDVQTLLPFDMESVILNSIKKTSRVLFFDEDIPGGATAYMIQEVLEKQDGYHYLDSKPYTLTAKEHRTPFGSEGDYFTKPQAEDVVQKVLEIMHEVAPDHYPALKF